MEGKQPEMDMNGIEQAGMPRTEAKRMLPQIDIRPDADKAVPRKEKPPVKPDRIEFSDQAKDLAQCADAPEVSRQEKVEAARKRLASGELFTPEAYRKAAEKMLRSGDLDKAEG